jgi:hypothetical protein
MTQEEHKAILAFIQGAVTDVQAPMDVEADAIIRALFKRNPDAAYRVTVLAMSLLAQPKAPQPQERRSWKAMLLERRERSSARRGWQVS